MAEDPLAVVQRMIDAGESEENIRTVIEHFKTPEPPNPTRNPGTEPGDFWGGFTKHMLTKEPGALTALGAGALLPAAAAGVPAAIIGGVSAALPLAAHVTTKVANTLYNKTPMTAPTIGEGAEVLSGPLAEYGAPVARTVASGIRLASPGAKKAVGSLAGMALGAHRGGFEGGAVGAMSGSWAGPRIADAADTALTAGAKVAEPLRPSSLAARVRRMVTGESVPEPVVAAPTGLRPDPKVYQYTEDIRRGLGRAIDVEPGAAGGLDDLDKAISQAKKESAGIRLGARKAEATATRAEGRADAQYSAETVAAQEQAAKDAENATRLAEIERRKEGLVPKKPTVSESLSATTPEGGRASSNVRFAPPKKVTVTESVPSTGGLSDTDRASLRKLGYSEATIDRIANQQARTATSPPVTPVDTVPPEAPVTPQSTGTSGMAPPSAKVAKMAEMTITPEDEAMLERVSGRPAGRGTLPAEPPDAPRGGVRELGKPPAESYFKTGLTKDQELALFDEGYSPEEIQGFTPLQADSILHGAREAGAIHAADPALRGLKGNERISRVREVRQSLTPEAEDTAGLLPPKPQKEIMAKIVTFTDPETAMAYYRKGNTPAQVFMKPELKRRGLWIEPKE